MVNPKFINKMWLTYFMAVVPKDASFNQIEETKLAFFAGSSSLFALMLLMMDDDSEPTAHDLRKMNWLQDEIDEFVALIKSKLDVNKIVKDVN